VGEINGVGTEAAIEENNECECGHREPAGEMQEFTIERARDGSGRHGKKCNAGPQTSESLLGAKGSRRR
jgi:hypothetical protein